MSRTHGIRSDRSATIGTTKSRDDEQTITRGDDWCQSRGEQPLGGSRKTQKNRKRKGPVLDRGRKRVRDNEETWRRKQECRLGGKKPGKTRKKRSKEKINPTKFWEQETVNFITAAKGGNSSRENRDVFEKR